MKLCYEQEDGKWSWGSFSLEHIWTSNLRVVESQVLGELNEIEGMDGVSVSMVVSK